MSTHATIRIERTDGTVTGISLHYDGYIEYAGIILQKHYNTTDAVEKLLELGDLETIDTEIKTCRFYHRDRNEKYRQSNFDNAYVYTFDALEQVWYVTYPDRERDEYVKLLCLSYTDNRIKKLLISAIAGRCKDNTVKQCIKAAMDARQEDIARKQVYHNEMYHIFCD